MSYIGEAYINDSDLFITYNARLIDDSHVNLLIEGDNKDFIENDQRSQPGKQVLVSNVQPKDREIDLTFLIECDTMQDFLSKYRSFMSVVKSGVINLRIPVFGETYKLIYRTSIGLDPFAGGKKAKVIVRFNEPNPTDRI